jgi:threonine dehydratase
MSPVVSLEGVRRAAEQVRSFIFRTPLLPMDDDIWVKPELLQPTGSFKVRGFFAAALSLPEERRQHGLMTVSAGNAALACAYVARRLAVPCRVVMPLSAPPPKIEGVRRLGGIPLLVPREELVDWLANRAWEGEPEAFIHPFADPMVQAGHGGIGLEILEQLPEVERVVTAVGGGGLISGIAAALKHLRPSVEVVGVQSDGYPLWPRTFTEGGPPVLMPNTIADGITAPYDATMHRQLVTCVDRWIVVPESRLRAAIGKLATWAKVVAEGAGALPVAALEQLTPGPTTVVVVSGGNIDPELLAQLLAEAHRSAL